MDLEALVRALVGRDDRGVADQGVVDTRVGDQVGLEFVQIDVECTIESQGGRDGADDLGDQAVEVLVAWAAYVQVATADVVNSLVIDEERAVGILNRAMSRQNGVVGLNNGSRDTRGRVDGELQLALLAVLGGQTLQQESTESRAGTATKGVEDQEALQAGAVVCRLVSSKFPSTCTLILRLSLPVTNSPATRRMRSMTLSTISLPMV